MTGPGSVAQRAYPEEFLSGKLTQVDVAGIERELRQLWQSAESAEPDSQRPAVSRACALNLILYSTDDDAETTAGNLLDEISVSHPCRALLAISRRSQGASLEAWVSARCHLPVPGAIKQICCEQITVRWQGEGVQELPSVVLPLLVSDLPVFLWWRAASFDRAAMSPFLPAVDRLVIDSARWSTPWSGLRDVAACLAERGGLPRLSDLSWTRLTAWREAIASAFDSAGTGLSVEDLGQIASVEVSYDDKAQSQVVLLTAWLSSRLGWRPVFVEYTTDGGIQLTFARRKRKIEVTWSPHPAAQPGPGSLRALLFRFSTGKQMTVQLEGLDSKRVLAIRSTAARPQVLSPQAPAGEKLIAPAPESSEPRLLNRELDILGFDSVFEEAVTVAAEIAELYELE
ncbi:MAG TPA: glucose-6-phosphate dehydrogenase assembly protein OpcA [Candidatus Obscuribacterales bacterium]